MPELGALDLSQPGGLPSGLKLGGFSDLHFQSEGVYYRLVSKSSTVGFKLPQPAWVQYRFHSLLPDREVTASVYLNGKWIENVAFPAAGRAVHYSAGPGKTGVNEWKVLYTCSGAPCPVPVPVYWLQLGFSDVDRLSARQVTGPHTEWWNLGSPKTGVTLQGLSAPLSDGTQVYRIVEREKVNLKWPADIKPLSLSFQATAASPFTVTAKSDGQVLGEWKGGPGKDVQMALSLYHLQPPPQEMTFLVRCPSDQPACVNLYDMNLGVQQPMVRTARQGALTSLLLSVLLLVLVWWLRPWQAVPRTPGPRTPTTTR